MYRCLWTPKQQNSCLMVIKNIKVVVTTVESMVCIHNQFEQTTVLFAYSGNDPLELLVASKFSSGKVEMVLLNTYSSEFQRNLLRNCVHLVLTRYMRLKEETCYEAGKKRCHVCVNKRRRRRLARII